jgi:hypothetical protein
MSSAPLGSIAEQEAVSAASTQRQNLRALRAMRRAPAMTNPPAGNLLQRQESVS